MNGRKQRMDFSLTKLARYRTPSGRAALAPVVVDGAGRQRADTRVGPRRLPGFAVVLLSHGQGLFWSEATGELPVAAPALIWLFPDVAHRYGPDDVSEWTESWALFDGNLPRDALQAGYFSPREPIAVPAQPAAVRRLIERLVDEFETMASAQAGLIIHELILSPRLASIAAPDADHIIDEAAERLRAAQSINLEDLARSLGLSPATLRRRFAARHGLSPKAYHLQQRLDRAKQMLTLGDEPIEDIAAALGFDDAYYFSRLFRSREQCSPSQFRQRHRRH